MSPLNQISNRRLMGGIIGLFYLWFGALKLFPGVSPAEDLAVATVHKLTLGLIPDNTSMLLLAIWEVGAGLFLIFDIIPRITYVIVLVHIILTFSPMVLIPGEVFNAAPFQLTIVGQYIIKNLLIVAVVIRLIQRKI